jgi:hypothetical protein
MITVNPICPISTRTAYFGARRIAPVAATSRTEAWGARPAVEELRPARPKTQHDETISPSDFNYAAGAYIAHVIGQFAPREGTDPRLAAHRYLTADTLGGDNPCLLVATI